LIQSEAIASVVHTVDATEKAASLYAFAAVIAADAVSASNVNLTEDPATAVIASGAEAVVTVAAAAVAAFAAVPKVATIFPVRSPEPAFAGTTDISPNPREATATTETFFNEIVFTIFLSLSQV
jgi:tetrahydromethanopterin S-methyltransferase subunit B